MTRAALTLTVMVGSLILMAMLSAILAPINVYDTLPIKCGHKLRDTCPSTGVSWK